jgi:phosphate transport system protein
MSKHLQRELEQLNRKLMSLFGDVERMINLAKDALCNQKVELVAGVIASDVQVDEREVEIEEDCLKILALHQCVAADLRRLTTVLKINSDLERIADLACNIASRARDVHAYPYFPIPDHLPEMVNKACLMVKMSLDSFVDTDLELAKDVIKLDASVDEYHLSVISELRDLMKQDSEIVEPALHCFTAARQIERIADLAENIAEDMIYYIDGEIVRHHHERIEHISDPNENR